MTKTKVPIPTEREVHRLVIPRWHPARLNQWDGRHWSKRAHLKRRDREMVDAYAKLADIPFAEVRRRVTVTIALPKRGRACDPDSYLKSLGDALVSAGLLVNDSRLWVEWMPVRYEWAAVWGTTIELEDLDP